jgi:hypothetical protein
MLRILALSAVGATAACSPLSVSSETERVLCEAWESTLFLPSRRDVYETAVGLNGQHVIFEAACPRR